MKILSSALVARALSANAARWRLPLVFSGALGLLFVGCTEDSNLPPASESSSGADAVGSSSSGDPGGSTGTEGSTTGEPMEEPTCLIASDCDIDLEFCDDRACVPRHAEGDGCERDGQCQDGLFCVVSVCLPPQPDGADCTEDGQDFDGGQCQGGACVEGRCETECRGSQCDEPDSRCCPAGEYCQSRVGIEDYCRPISDEGGPCDTWNAELACGDGLYCDGSSCRPQLPDGADCDFVGHWPECGDGLECDLNSLPPTCAPS